MPGQAGINAARRGQPHRQPMHQDKVGERIQSRLDHDRAESGGQLANGRQLIGSGPSAAGREQPYHPGLIGDGHRPVPVLHRVISLAPGQRGLAQLQRRLAGQTVVQPRPRNVNWRLLISPSGSAADTDVLPLRILGAQLPCDLGLMLSATMPNTCRNSGL
jgi:hypothetical protein